MSCMIAQLAGGSPEIFPLRIDQMKSLREAGQASALAMGLDEQDLSEEYEHIGAAKRTDGTPFYLWALAPDLKSGVEKPWTGAFYAPFGVGSVRGKLEAEPGKLDSDEFGTNDKYAITEIRVTAELEVTGTTSATASWTVIGSQLTAPNKSAMIKSLDVADSGPHEAEDVRRCIALHAPQRALGDPRAIVSMQCGVAAASLIEAIC